MSQEEMSWRRIGAAPSGVKGKKEKDKNCILSSAKKR
jgi:hypothetical protein